MYIKIFFFQTERNHFFKKIPRTKYGKIDRKTLNYLNAKSKSI